MYSIKRWDKFVITNVKLFDFLVNELFDTKQLLLVSKLNFCKYFILEMSVLLTSSVNCNKTDNCECNECCKDTYVYIPDLRYTLYIENITELRGFIEEMQDPTSHIDGVVVKTKRGHIELNADATLEEFQVFVYKLLRLVTLDEESKYVILIFDSNIQLTSKILDYVFTVHCTNFKMIRNLVLIVRLGEKTTMFVFFTGMDSHEIEVEIEAHKVEFGL